MRRTACETLLGACLLGSLVMYSHGAEGQPLEAPAPTTEETVPLQPMPYGSAATAHPSDVPPPAASPSTSVEESPTGSIATGVAPASSSLPPSGAPPEVHPTSNHAGANAETLLDAAERAMLDVDYEQSLALAEQAIAEGSLTRDEVRRAYLTLAFSAAQLDRHDIAQPAFLKLFAIDPTADFSRRLAPARRSSAITARNYWSQRSTTMRVKTALDRVNRQLFITTEDPLRWLRSLNVWVRKAGGEYTKNTLEIAQSNVIHVDVDPLDVIEVYVAALDATGNVIVETGSAPHPQRFAPSAEERTTFERDIRGGQPGSYAQRLSELGAQTSVHGYTSLEFGPRPDGNGATFDLNHATLFFKAALPPYTSMEVGLDVQHLTTSRETLTVPHAFVDVAFCEWLVVRPGFFEAPIGAFNEYLYPDFLRTTGLAPLFSRVVVPGLWSEVGVQVRGRLALAPRAHLTYAAFVSNGLEQFDPSLGDGVVAEGGELSDMRFNVRDRNNSDKAIGGRVGLQSGGFDMGASGYTGRYTVDAHRRLTIADMDVSYRTKWFTVRAEGAAAFQEVTDGIRIKKGGYVLASSRAEPHLEPYLQFDVVDDGEVQQRLLFGNAVYPFPKESAARTLRLKTEVGFTAQASRDSELVWLTQLVSGF